MHVNHSQINSSKTCGFESHDRTKGFHRKTARQNTSQTDNHHVRQSFIWQLSLCGNYTLIFDPETRHTTVAHFDFTEQTFEAFVAPLYSYISGLIPADIMIILLSA